MSTEPKLLFNALRPLPCKWVGCAATLSSWALLKKHSEIVHIDQGYSTNYTCCYKDSAKSKQCSLGFHSRYALLEHVLSIHLRPILFHCPVRGCKQNLRRLDNDDLQEHFDFHLAEGESLGQAVPRRIPHERTPRPLYFGRAQPAYRLAALNFLAPAFTQSALAKAKAPVQWKPDSTEVVFAGWLQLDLMVEEEDETPAALKPRQLRLGKGQAEINTAKSLPIMPVPPRFPGAHNHLPPPSISVGFRSAGFHKTAEAAFDTVAAEGSDSDSDMEPDSNYGSNSG